MSQDKAAQTSVERADEYSRVYSNSYDRYQGFVSGVIWQAEQDREKLKEFAEFMRKESIAFIRGKWPGFLAYDEKEERYMRITISDLISKFFEQSKSGTA